MEFFSLQTRRSQSPSLALTSLAQVLLTSLLAMGYPAQSSADQGKDFTASAHLAESGGRGDEYDVVLWTEGDKAFVDYASLGCRGELTPDYYEDRGFLSMLDTDRALGFSEMLFGDGCVSGGRVTISDDGYGGWLIERQPEGTWTWRGATTLEVGAARPEQAAQGAPKTPPGTVAAEPNLGLFLGVGPDMDGIGPTSMVTGVTAGGIAEVFGIQPGELVLWVDETASIPTGQVSVMNESLRSYGATDLEVGDASGNRRTVRLFSPKSPSIDRLMAAAREDEFGPATDRVSFRLRLIADGSFEALKILAANDAFPSPTDRDIEFLVGLAQPPYATLIANYANARLHYWGACGEAVTPASSARGSVLETKRGGVSKGTDDLTYELNFDVLTKFADTIAQVSPYAVPGEVGTGMDALLGNTAGWPRLLAFFGPAEKGLGCESAGRKQLEDNMLAYLRGAAPTHVKPIP